MKINIKNNDPKYWERILRKHMLSEEQLDLSLPEIEDNEEPVEGIIEDVSDIEEAPEPERLLTQPVSDTNSDYALLRTKLDVNDNFMSGGHQIKKIRVTERRTGDWALDDSAVREVIDAAFPRWRDPSVKRFRRAAARTARVLYLYYRVQLPRKMVALEMGLDDNTVNKILANVNRVRRELKLNTLVEPLMKQDSGD